MKPELIQLDIIAQNAAEGWKRPIYFATTLASSSYLNMKEFMQLEGYAYRLMPFKVLVQKMALSIQTSCIIT
jgi:hypothetical protein